MSLKRQYDVADSVRVKARAMYKCEHCGSDQMIQAHAPDRDHTDWHKGVALCAKCHSKQHPEVPQKLFSSKNHQPYWHNVSAKALADALGCHSRTVIRQAKRLSIPTNCDITPIDVARLLKRIRLAEVVQQNQVQQQKARREKERQILMYEGGGTIHASLDISREQVQELKLMAIRRDTSVKSLITQIVEKAIGWGQIRTGSRG